MMMDKVKTAQTSKNFHNFYFLILEYIDQGLSPSQIAKKNGMSKQSLNYYIRQLKACNAIIKVGYNAWKVVDREAALLVKTSKNYTARPPSRFITPYVSDGEVRGHAFRFVIRLPFIPGWSDRRDFFRRMQVRFKSIPYGESLEVRGHKVKVFSKSLDVYFNPGWSSFSADAETSFSFAILELKHVLSRFEALLGISVRRANGYVFSVSRQHYSLVKNALAKQYLKDKVKLEVFNLDGSKWFIIDNSYHLEEAEHCHKDDARSDTKKVQDWFNGVKSTGITPEFILEGFDALIKDRQFYAENNRKHVDVIGKLGVGVEELTRVIKELKKGRSGDFR